MAKRAVLIGINKYRIPGADLRGCVNDVKSIESVLTHSLAAELRAAKGKSTYREAHTGTLARLNAGGFDQVPQLEGRKAAFDLAFLSVR